MVSFKENRFINYIQKINIMSNYQFWQMSTYGNVLEFENELEQEEFEWEEIKRQREIDSIHEWAELQLEIN